MFNEDQLGYMASLSKISPSAKCWCGWYLLGECPHCPKDKTNADRIAASCPTCGNSPMNYGAGTLVHCIGFQCSKTKRQNIYGPNSLR